VAEHVRELGSRRPQRFFGQLAIGDVDGRPDVIIPGRDEYLNKSYPIDKLCVIGVKTTCKDRWRQVLAKPQESRKSIC